MLIGTISGIVVSLYYLNPYESLLRNGLMFCCIIASCMLIGFIFGFLFKGIFYLISLF